MGYTHYWYRKPELNTAEQYGRLALDAKLLLDEAKSRGLLVADWSGETLDGYEFNEGRFAFNGYRAESHESFIWQAIPTIDRQYEGETFDFCKTAHKPYDQLVTAVLLRAKYHYGDAVRLASDGFLDNWILGVNLYETVFAEAIPNSEIVSLVHKEVEVNS